MNKNSNLLYKEQLIINLRKILDFHRNSCLVQKLQIDSQNIKLQVGILFVMVDLELTFQSHQIEMRMVLFFYIRYNKQKIIFGYSGLVWMQYLQIKQEALQELNQMSNDCEFLLMGYKCDLDRKTDSIFQSFFIRQKEQVIIL
ncbi:unnamed protein product [Paramecium sonneborni]|uniref:Uncharacterized protein n=1 Tax=Paramecium sonneborni TaxID=65129 RepID=A0A8S1NRD9_9CILI|nr:unnamed protein product [Paramecium sonneborni]